MPEHLTDRGEIRAAGKHLDRERVPEPVRVHVPKPGPLSGAQHHPADR